MINGKEASYDLKKDPKKIAEDVLKQIQQHVLPIFEVLNSRDAILAHRREYPAFDSMNCHQILLEEAMIYGRRGEEELARERFLEYYQMQLKEYYEVLEHGTKHYLQKGEKLVYRNRQTEKT